MNKRKLWLILALVLAVAAGVGTALWRFRGHWAKVEPEALAITEQKAVMASTQLQPTGQGEALLLINREHPCPVDESALINVYAQKDRGFSLANSSILLDKNTFEAAKAMFQAAAADGVDGFILSSGYRDASQQEQLYEQDPSQAQAPGTSEHQSGLAFDVTAYGNSDFSATPQFRWLYRHCWDYGFILRYPSDKTQITGIPAESWHYRYVGLPHSRIMAERGLCLEEYVEYIRTQGTLEVQYDGRTWQVEYSPDGVVRSRLINK
jgi:D-alanyl-D-alanine carboxypeptidase